MTRREPRLAKSKRDNPFIGHWRITESELWDREALDLVGPAFIEFDTDGMGQCRFIAVQGWLDCRFGERGGMPSVEFSWEGQDEGDDCCGRGWGIIRERSFEGRWFFHRGDDSWFLATKSPARAARKRATRARHLTRA